MNSFIAKHYEIFFWAVELFFDELQRRRPKGSGARGVVMHHRYEGINIPIEIIRTLVAIAELGSYSRAGVKLGLTQPAISAQVKRVQAMVGGALFERTGQGAIGLTPLGGLVL